MNKAELIEALTVRLGDKRSAGDALEAVLAEIQSTVTKGEKVSIAGFGVFEKRVRAARTARNPRTGEAVRVKKTAVPAFRPGAGFKTTVASGKVPRELKATPAKATPAKTTTAKTTTAKTTTAKAAPATKTTAAKAAPAKKTTAKKAAPAKKTTAKKVTAKKAAPAKSTAKKTTAKKTSKATASKATTRKSAAKKAPARKAAKATRRG